MSRLRISERGSRHSRRALLRDVRYGFACVPKRLPPKYFYDDRGGQLFDAICDTPEYYLTRVETEILAAHAGDIIAATEADTLVELGSGAARKTRVLLDALVGAVDAPVYAPIDIDERMVRLSSQRLLEDYRSLRIDAAVADYDTGLHVVPQTGRRVIAFLGSTIGNYHQPKAVRFLRGVAATMEPRDHVLIGFDLAKSPAVLHAAYNDAAGLTAEFNLNLLRVLNRELDADFDLDRFEHEARYWPVRGQVEMYLWSRTSQVVRVGALDRSFVFKRGERIRTEISRKFGRAQIEAMFRGAGLELRHWYTDAQQRFALVVARRRT